MNLYELLKNELEEKSNNWNIKEKIDYIYIRTLQILKHDSRWLLSDDKDLKDYLFDRELNIFNLEYIEVICSSWSKAFCELLNCLLMSDEGFDMALTEGNAEPHMFARVFMSNGIFIDYDPLDKTNDFARAKTNSKLKGIHDNLDELEKEKIYRKIGYEIKENIFTSEEKSKMINSDNTDEIIKIILRKIDYKNLTRTELFYSVKSIFYSATGFVFIDLNVKSLEKHLVKTNK